MTTSPLSPDETRIAWQIGELGYKLRNHQKKTRLECLKIHQTSVKWYLEANRRYGKSTEFLVMLTEDAIKNPGAEYGFFAPVKEGLGDYIGDFDKPDTPIGQVFSDCPLDLRPTLDATLSLLFPNGAKILFRGSNNKQHRVRRGKTYRKVAIDECRDVDELQTLIDSVIIPSLFSVDGRLMMGSTPADTDDHDLKAYRDEAELNGWLSYANIYDCARYDTLDFPAARIAQWKAETKDPIAWLREYETKWVKDPSKAMIPEWDDKYAIAAAPRDEFFAFYHKYDGLDSGVTDKTAGILGYYDFKTAKLYIEAEFTLQDSAVRTDEIARRFKTLEKTLGYQAWHDKDKTRHFPQNEKVYRRVADNNNLILVNDLNALYDLDFIPTRKDEFAAMINTVREWIQNGRINVLTSCPELLGCLRNAIWDKKREKLAKSKVFGHFDALMALVYLVRNVDAQTNPIPAHFNKSWATHGGVPMNANVPQTGGDRLAAVFNVKTDRDVARADFARGRVE
jgi:hypothetical protein